MKKIIAVDDDPEMRQLLTELLRGKFQILTADDGEAGLGLIKKENPDLVILDLLMPRMHGFEVVQRMRQDPELRDIKVLICSSKSYAADQATARKAGADAYLTKPYAIDDLLAKVEELAGGGSVKTPVSLRFWGTRGSIPCPGAATQRYGGNTPCVELRVGDRLIIIDAGSGLRPLGNALMKESQGRPITADLLIGHTHWDHIQGLPFFVPFYLPKNRFTIHGVHGTTGSLADALAGQMSHPYFPVEMKSMCSDLKISELSGPIEIGPARITYHFLNHPGITVGFRVQTGPASICYLSDHEPYGRLNDKGEFSAKEDDDVARFAEDADLLISEAQYTEEGYKYRRSWGHSTFTDVIELAVKARVKRLALFHHDPDHDDGMMDRFIGECRGFISRRGHKLDCFGAQEGMSLDF